MIDQKTIDNWIELIYLKKLEFEDFEILKEDIHARPYSCTRSLAMFGLTFIFKNLTFC